MRQVKGLKLAAICGAVGLMGMANISRGQVVNGTWESPTNAAGGTDTNVTGWTMDPTLQVGGAAGNPGQRCTFFGSADAGGSWSFWIQTFEASGDAFQDVTGVVPGSSYTFGSDMFFQLGSGTTTGPTDGYDAVTGLDTFLEIQFLNKFASPVGSPTLTNIPAGSVTDNGIWDPYSVSAIAPVGATGAEILIGWTGGGSDNGTGSQSAGADDATFGITPTPEPASLGMLALGGLAMLRRRR
jgi:hypothetical protein